MELFTLILMEPSEEASLELAQRLQDAFGPLHNSPNGVAVQALQLEGHSVVRVEAILPGFQLHEQGEAVYSRAGDAIAGYVQERWESAILKDLIIREYHYTSQEDVEHIQGYCKQFLFYDHEGLISSDEINNRRRYKIAAAVTEYLRAQTRLNLEGFLRFRLNDYIDEMREVVEYAIDEFMMDRQYQEFISLLKYFVYIQEAKIPAAHLVHKGGHEFLILNDKWEPIDTSALDSSFTLEILDKDINLEDMIVSTLITVSPQTIFIHTREPDQQVIHTITQIFENRSTVCSYCRSCQAHFGEVKMHDQLSP
ncbi:sporulation protein YtxC [Paenibacillus chartarius]|uniref:Sporulation protein YtxC n=1 Tax=Paenibacillus chartarius TaxID=747481 RepID=A0ABV6DK29_9BACL